MKVLIAGDLVPSGHIKPIINNGKYDKVIGEDVKRIIENEDYSIVNLECPIVNSPSVKPIEKSGPCLKSTEKVVDFIKYAGFNAVTLANNHFRDYGNKGVVSTIEKLQSHNIDYVGGGINLDEASKTLFIELENKRLAIINCCEQEFSIANKDNAGSNPLNPIEQYYRIIEAKKTADHVIVIVHGGIEHYQLPTLRMKELYRFFIDAGADAVVNHHQHCYTGYEIYNGRPIFYGIGNFCFDMPNRPFFWYEGYLVEITLEESISFRLIPYRQSDEGIHLLKDKTSFEKNIKKMNSIIADDTSLEKSFKELIEIRKVGYVELLEPIRHRLWLALRRRGIVPSFVSNKIKKLMLNIIRCESHRDLFIQSLNNN